MNFEQHEYDLISDYLRDNLTADQKESVERRMELEEDFKKEVQLHKGIATSLNDEGWVNWDHKNNQAAIATIKESKKSAEIVDLETKISAVSDTYFKNETSRKGSFYRKYFIGIAAAAVVCFFLINRIDMNSPTSELYTTHVDWNHNLVSKIEQSATNNDASQIGESLFKSGEYDKAKTVFLDVIDQTVNPDNHSLMYLGASYLELEQYDQALRTFTKLLEGGMLDSNRGYWYRAMVYLKKEDKEAAIKELKVLTANPENYNYNEALELLSKLN